MSDAASVASNAASAASQYASVASQAASAASNYASVASNAASIASAAGAAEVSLASDVARISTDIVSVHNVVSALSAGLGTVQMAVVGNTQSISASTDTQVSGLSISIAANGVYQVDVKLLYNVSAISTTGFRIGFTASSFTQQNCNGHWYGTSAMAVSTGGTNVALVNQPFNGMVSAHFSVVSAGTAQVNILRADAMIVASTTAGSLNVVARVTIGTVSMYLYKGSYIRAHKIA